MSRFGDKVRQLRKSKGLGQRAFGQMVGISHTYVSKIENEKLDFGDYPSEELICKMAAALEADEDELLILAKKIPEHIRKRVLARPDVFCKLARLDDDALEWVLAQVITRTSRQLIRP